MHLPSLLVISSLAILQTQATENTEPTEPRSLLNHDGIEPFLYLDDFLPDSVGFFIHSDKKLPDNISNISSKLLSTSNPASVLTNDLSGSENPVKGYNTHIDILEDGMNVNFTYRY
ncbi:hypothetical protein CI610_02131 [invertebrate metagenome]|uniref:Uncharacterized protein n=1 Tax=invertebrate metagenome TaxID=1711999 RepID=A0A2H9T6R4_9ZZZZ